MQKGWRLAGNNVAAVRFVKKESICDAMLCSAFESCAYRLAACVARISRRPLARAKWGSDSRVERQAQDVSWVRVSAWRFKRASFLASPCIAFSNSWYLMAFLGREARLQAHIKCMLVFILERSDSVKRHAIVSLRIPFLHHTRLGVSTS